MEVIMQSLTAVKGNELFWKQPKFLHYYFELYQEDAIFADLYWTKMLSDEAVGRVVDRWWTFNRLGWLRDRIKVSIANSNQIVALFEFDWLKNGEILLANGRSFTWYCTKLLARKYAMVESGDNLLFEIEHGFHWFKQQAWVKLLCQVTDPDLSLLLCLSMYLLYIINNDLAGAVAATAVITSV
jgi:hypothetical protein